jgi:hypothetical protein
MCPFVLNSELSGSNVVNNYEGGGGRLSSSVVNPTGYLRHWFQCLQSALPYAVTFKTPYLFARNTELWTS